jgi:hypothetical protein
MHNADWKSELEKRRKEGQSIEGVDARETSTSSACCSLGTFKSLGKVEVVVVDGGGGCGKADLLAMFGSGSGGFR